VYIVTPLISNSKSSELVKPRDGSLYNPSEDTQATSVLGVASGDYGSDAQPAKRFTVWLRVVSPVSDQDIGLASGTPRFAANRGNGFDQRNELRDIVCIGAGQYHSERNTVSVRDDVVLASRFPPIRGIRTDLRPPKRALTEPESATALDQSILSASRNLANITSWIFSQTPAFCQSRRYRQQVMPEPHPISVGSISHGMPLLSTKMMPVRTSRRSNGFRPGFRYRRFFGGGSTGSITAHSSSLINSAAMCGPPKRPSTHSIAVSTLKNAHFVRGSYFFLIKE
jgi:hypothetical protein